MRDGWERVPLGQVFDTTNIRLGEHAEEPDVFSVTKYDGFVPADEYFGKRIASAKLDTYKVVEPDEWAYSTIHIDEGSIARNRLGRRGVVSPMYTTMRLKSNRVHPYYAELLLRSPWMLARYSDAQQGSINRRRSLPWKVFAGLTIPVPPLHEQRRIVDLIGALDDTIAAAERRLKCLRAARSSLLSSLLSRRAGWQALRLDDVCRLNYGKALRETDREAGYVPVVGSAGRFALHSVGNTDNSDWTIVVGRKGTAGSVTWIDGPAWVTDTAYWAQPIDAVAPRFLFLLLQHADLPSVCAQTGVPGLNRDRAGSLAVAVPPVDEQKHVVGLVGSADNVIAAAEHHASGLHELRSNLLTALLSGEHPIPESYDELTEELAA